MDLFDTTMFIGRALPSHASARNCIGQVAQEFVCRALRVESLPIDGRREVCPDFDGGEVKSVGKNNNALVYKWRLEKDLKHHDAESFIYVFLRHSCSIKCENASDIARNLVSQRPNLLIVTLAELEQVLSARPVKRFSLFEKGEDPRIGYNRPGYRDGGWQFRLSVFEATYASKKFLRWQGRKIQVHISATDGGAVAAKKYIGKMKQLQQP